MVVVTVPVVATFCGYDIVAGAAAATISEWAVPKAVRLTIIVSPSKIRKGLLLIQTHPIGHDTA